MDRVVVLDTGQPMEFLTRAAAALAEAVDGLRVSGETDDVVDVYAEVLCAQARILVRQRQGDTEHDVWCKRVQHLMSRADEVLNGRSDRSLFEITDQLHGLLADVYAAT